MVVVPLSANSVDSSSIIGTTPTTSRGETGAEQSHMKLELKCRTGVHTEMVTAVAWTPDNELYSMSDDSTIHRWDGGGEPAGKVRLSCAP